MHPPMRGGVHTTAVAIISSFLALGTLSCNDSSPTAPTPPGPGACTFQLAPSTQTIESQGGAVTVGVTTSAQCSWTAQSDASWMTITSGATGTGPGTVSLTASSNPASSNREAGLTVASQSVRFTQRGRSECTFTVSSPSQRFGPEGGRGQISIDAAAGCGWTAASSENWLVLDKTSGTGAGQVDYTVSPYTGTAERSVQVTVAEKTLTVRQDPVQRQCEYSASPVDFRLHWHGIGGGEIQVVTEAGCKWTIRSTENWMTVTGGESREGPARVLFSTGEFTADATRRAPIEVRWPTPTAGQNIWVTQEGCRYGMNETPQTFGPAGGSGRTDVVTQPVSIDCMQGCPWTAVSTVPWIRITSGHGPGENPVLFVVDPNPGPGTRTGEIVVQTRRLVITQTF
jgi:hypothetical protein